MLTVITAATTLRLSTVPALREMLGPDGASADEITLGATLDRASAQVARYCNRTFGLETVEEVIRPDAPLRTLVLQRCPVTEVVSVVQDGVTLQASAYEVDTASGIMWRLEVDERTSWSARKVVVRYGTGWTLPGAPGRNLPADIERATLVTCVAAYRARGRDPMLRSEQVENVGAFSYLATTDQGSLPPEAEEALAMWVAPVLF